MAIDTARPVVWYVAGKQNPATGAQGSCGMYDPDDPLSSDQRAMFQIQIADAIAKNADGIGTEDAVRDIANKFARANRKKEAYIRKNEREVVAGKLPLAYVVIVRKSGAEYWKVIRVEKGIYGDHLLTCDDQAYIQVSRPLNEGSPKPDGAIKAWYRDGDTAVWLLPISVERLIEIATEMEHPF